MGPEFYIKSPWDVNTSNIRKMLSSIISYKLLTTTRHVMLFKYNLKNLEIMSLAHQLLLYLLSATMKLLYYLN